MVTWGRPTYGVGQPPGGPAVLPLRCLSPNGHMADDLGVLGQNLLEEMFKIIFQGILKLKNIFGIFRKRKCVRKILACKKQFLKF